VEGLVIATGFVQACTDLCRRAAHFPSSLQLPLNLLHQLLGGFFVAVAVVGLSVVVIAWWICCFVILRFQFIGVVL
jgi:hypothetical protein